MSCVLYLLLISRFDVTSVLNADLSLNEEAWETAGPMLLTPYFGISYALSFGALSSILVHVYLWHWEEIKEGKPFLSLQGDHAESVKLCRAAGSLMIFTSKLGLARSCELKLILWYPDAILSPRPFIMVFRHVGYQFCRSK